MAPKTSTPPPANSGSSDDSPFSAAVVGAVGGASALLVLVLVTTFIAGVLVCVRRRSLALVNNIEYHTTTDSLEVKADRNVVANPHIATTTNEAYGIHHNNLVASNEEGKNIPTSANEAYCPVTSSNEDFNIATSAHAYEMVTSRSTEGYYAVPDILTSANNNYDDDSLVYDYVNFEL